MQYMQHNVFLNAAVEAVDSGCYLIRYEPSPLARLEAALARETMSIGTIAIYEAHLRRAAEGTLTTWISGTEIAGYASPPLLELLSDKSHNRKFHKVRTRTFKTKPVNADQTSRVSVP